MALAPKRMKFRTPSYKQNKYNQGGCVIRQLEVLADSPSLVEGSRKIPTTLCYKHKDENGDFEKNVYVCWEESKLICPQCFIEEHQDHKCFGIGYLVRYYRDTLENSIKIVEENIKQAEEVQAPHEKFRLSFKQGYDLIKAKIRFMDKAWEKNGTNVYSDCNQIFKRKCDELSHFSVWFQKEFLKFKEVIFEIRQLLGKEDTELAINKDTWMQLIDKARTTELADELEYLPQEKHEVSDYYPIFNTITNKVEIITLRRVFLQVHSSNTNFSVKLLEYMVSMRESTLIRDNLSFRFLNGDLNNWDFLITTNTSIFIIRLVRCVTDDNMFPSNSMMFEQKDIYSKTVEITQQGEKYQTEYTDFNVEYQPKATMDITEAKDAFPNLIGKIFESTEQLAHDDVVLRMTTF